MAWSLYKKEEFLKPLTFSNGKTQEDIVNEVLEAIKSGEKIIFVHGMCGTGKSAIALNIANALGKSSIVVPVKSLQSQYQKDYGSENEGGKHLLKEDKEKLKISVITGRNNHKCKFLEDNKNAIPSVKKEVDSKLHDIFSGRREKLDEAISNDLSAANPNIPCKIEIKERNVGKIKEYLKQNKRVNPSELTKISDIKRLPIASVCPYWSPVFPDEYDIKVLDEKFKRTYEGLKGKKFVFYRRKEGCPFYEQFFSYMDSDVIVFNSMKYHLESAMNRKPLTEVEIIDECDEFLDSFSNQRAINIERLLNSLNNLFVEDEEKFKQIVEAREILQHLKRDKRIFNATNTNDILRLKETGIYDLFKIFNKSLNFLENVDEENYVFDVEKTAKVFEEFLDESYVLFERKEENLIAKIVTTNLSKRFKEMVDKNKAVVLMSGTLHSDEVLKNIFGLEKFKIIQAEDKQPGKVSIKKTGLEIDCKYSNFSSGKFTRGDYLKALDKCVEVASKPALIHVHAFQDLPSEYEIFQYGLKNLKSSESLREEQKEDKENQIIWEFKLGKEETLFSTKCSRGIDFPGDQCKSIIFTKYPNPNIRDPFWKILSKTNPMQYWSFYRDKSRREILQKIYRGLRFKEDKVELLSPDLRVLDFFEKDFT